MTNKKTVYKIIFPNNLDLSREIFASPDEKSITIGRGENCTITIKKKPRVSMHHCLVYMQIENSCKTNYEFVYIKDISTNGTFLNGRKLKRNEIKKLSDGDEVIIDKDLSFIFKRLLQKPHNLKEFDLMETKNIKKINNMYSNGCNKSYYIQNLVGEGQFSVVKMGIDSETNECYAVKIYKGKKNMFSQELSLLTHLKHKNIIEVKDTIVENNDEDVSYNSSINCIVMEYCSGGDLDSFISSQKSCCLNENITKQIMEQLFSAVQYIHKNHIIHRDIKPSNILILNKIRNLDSNRNIYKLVIKLADFGLATTLGSSMKSCFDNSICGTKEYIAPEMINSYNSYQFFSSSSPDLLSSSQCSIPSQSEISYSYPVDIWSSGVTMMVCLYGKKILSKKQFENKNKLNFNENYSSKELYYFLKGCLQVDPEKRFTANMALTHPWIKVNTKYSLSKSLSLQGDYQIDSVLIPQNTLPESFASCLINSSSFSCSPIQEKYHIKRKCTFEDWLPNNRKVSSFKKMSYKKNYCQDDVVLSSTSFNRHPSNSLSYDSTTITKISKMLSI